jgi:hypothetical protein
MRRVFLLVSVMVLSSAALAQGQTPTRSIQDILGGATNQRVEEEGTKKMRCETTLAAYRRASCDSKCTDECKARAETLLECDSDLKLVCK